MSRVSEVENTFTFPFIRLTSISESSGSESEVKDPFENKETEKKTSKKGVKKDGTESE